MAARAVVRESQRERTTDGLPAESEEKGPSIYKHMVRGSAWSIATRWMLRSIGLVNTVVLARLLTPDDFGVAATGALTVGFIQGFSELGAQQLVIRERDVDRDDYDTAWTVQILQGFFVAILLLAGAPLASSYFGDERAVAVVRLLAVSAVLDGATNIGLVLARKELNFAIDFKFRAIARVLAFVVTLILALTLRNYWALVFSAILMSALRVPLSYWMHPYRARLSLVKIRNNLRFASAIVPMKIGRYLNGKVDVLVVGGLAGTAQLGVYNVASELAGMLTKELLQPIGQGLLPSYAKLNHDSVGYAEAFRHVLASSATLVFPFGFGLWLVAPQVVQIVLGEQWISAVPIVQTLALYYTVTSLLHTMSAQVLIATGHEHRTAILVWARLLLLVPAVVLAGKHWGVEGVAVGAVIAALVATPFVIWMLTKSIALSVPDVASALWRPLVAAVGMAGVVSTTLVGASDGVFLSLILEVMVGASVYVALIYILWSFSGRPKGLEGVVLDFLTRKLLTR